MILTIENNRIEPDIMVVKLSGRITLGRECQRIEPLVDELVKQNERKVVFDLSAVDYIDSAGLGVITSCFGKLRRVEGQFRVGGAVNRVEELFVLTQINTLIPTFPTLEEALQGLGATGQAGAS